MGVSEEEYYFIYPVGYGLFFSSLFINFQNPIKLSVKKKNSEKLSTKTKPTNMHLIPTKYK